MANLTVEAVMGELSSIVEEYGNDERKVLLVLARRLLAGQRQYGKIDLAHDTRDWRAQRAEEFSDALFYTMFAEIAATDRSGG